MLLVHHLYPYIVHVVTQWLLLDALSTAAAIIPPRPLFIYHGLLLSAVGMPVAGLLKTVSVLRTQLIRFVQILIHVWRSNLKKLIAVNI